VDEPNKIKVDTPEEHTGIRRSKPKQKAAGIPALISSTKHILEEMPLAKGMKVLNQLNQKGGVDCPGCAWPDPDDERSKLGEYCENGVKAIAEEATSKKLTPGFFKTNGVAALSQLSDYEIGKKGRIAQPMYLPAGSDHYESITWEAAFEKIATQLNKLDNPNQAIFYTSGRTSNEAAFLYQLFVRAYGTNNLPDCSNMCHESSGVALSETLGIGKGSVKLEDFYEAELILVMGQNPGTNHPRMLSALQKAKRNGAKIVTVNPIKETGLISFSHPQEIKSALGMGTTLSDHYLQIRLNADMALIQAVVKLLLLEEDKEKGKVFDWEFIKSKTAGVESYLDHIRTLDEDVLIQQTGINKDQILALVDLLVQKKKIIVCWAMGLTQHKNAVNTIKEVVNLLLLKGSVGKPGAGTCPVRGHSNVQGDRTMGIHEKPAQVLLDNIEKTFDFKPPQEHGYDTVAAIEAMHSGDAKVFFGMGGNFISATPDTFYTAEALQNCELTVHVSTKLNRSHLVHGKEALILPCLARTDEDIQNDEAQFVSVENSMGVVHSSRGNLPPISDQLMSEPMIVCYMAKATLAQSTIDWDKYMQHYDHIRDSIEKTIKGFENYNERVREPSGFYLPNCARDNEYNTKTGKANFSISNYEAISLNKGEYLMMTIRSHDQFNTTIYGLDDRYRGIYQERRVVMMNAMDMADAGLEEYQWVDLSNDQDGQLRVAKKFVVIEYDIPRQCIATYFPEANILVPIKSKADKSHTPVSKSVVVKVQRTKV